MSSEIIRIKNLNFSYQADKLLFKNLNLAIPRGVFSIFKGATGCGKSTLLKIIAGLVPEFGGNIEQGQIERNFKTWAMIFQNPDQQFTMATPRQEFIFTMENLQLNRETAQSRIAEAVKQTQISKLLDQKFSDLSGGEKQRVAFAVTMAMQPDLLLLDEPFASCDQHTRHFLIEQLAQLKQQGVSIIVSDHDLTGYKFLCDQIVEFEQNTVQLLTKNEQNKLFIKKPLTRLAFTLPNSENSALFCGQDFSLKQGDKLLLDHSNFKIFPQTATFLSGDNGSGKTSLFKALTKLLTYQGQLTYQNTDIKKLKAKDYLTHVSQIFQNADDQFIMVTVGEELALSQKYAKNPALTEKKLTQALTLLGLNKMSERVVYSLSGGQKKKLQILLMLIANPEVLLLDEPFVGLDDTSCQLVIKLLQDTYLKFGKTAIIISHQTRYLDQLCHYHLVLKNQQLTYVKD